MNNEIIQKKIEDIYSLQEPLIERRNIIFDNHFKYYNPFYWKELKEIDKKLKELDISLHGLYLLRCFYND